tara:strand:+ start:121 stop:705 length:585 start_codon:yes stop_codon:yes gene_type:complete
MFNGIIYSKGKLIGIKKLNKSYLIEMKNDFNYKKSDLGSSIACNGVCLTLTEVNSKSIFFYLSEETLKKTNFKKVRLYDYVNIEKSLKYGETLSGHFIQGHVDTTAIVKKIVIVDKTWVITFSIQKKYLKYMVYKGSITVNGVSLTISLIQKNDFIISIIPHTLKLTNLIKLKKRDMVNIEFDIIGKYLHKLKN